jgi:hypothetical protein
MLTLAAGHVSDRKLRLYLVGCCRRRWELFPDKGSQQALRIAEQFADAAATDTELGQAVLLAREVVESRPRPHSRWQPTDYVRTAAEAAWIACDSPTDLRRLSRYRLQLEPLVWAAGALEPLAAAYAAYSTMAIGGGPTLFETVLLSEQTAQVHLLRCVFGNPFVYTVPDPRWLTSAVLGLAKAMYAERAFDRLPILADALEEAGCDDEAVLSHCRQDREHARGCWVVDLLLGQS